MVCSDLGVRVPGTKGASLHLQAISTALARAGHDVLLVAVAGHGPPPSEVATLLLPHPGRSEGVRRELRKLAFVERLHGRARADVAAFRPDVLLERLALFGTAGRRLAAETGAVHALEINALLADEERRWRGLRLGPVARRREAAVVRGAALRVPVSEELAAQVRALAPGAPTEVLPNGVEAGAFAELPARADARAAFALPADRPLVGFTGSLRPWHGLHVALDALPGVPEALLVVAGDGEIRGELEDRARRLGVTDRVRWLGHVDHARVPVLLAALDVAVAPYPPLESFAYSPLKLFEYLAAGVPVVASRVGQVTTILEDGRRGTLVSPGDAVDLAAALRTVLVDAGGGARSVAAEARGWALREHSWDARARRLTALLEEHRSRALAA